MIISIFDNLHWYKHISHIFIYTVYQWYTINEWAIFHPGDQVRHRVDVARKSQGLHGAMLVKFSLNIDWRLIKYWLNDWILQEGKHTFQKYAQHIWKRGANSAEIAPGLCKRYHTILQRILKLAPVFKSNLSQGWMVMIYGFQVCLPQFHDPFS